MSILCSRAPTRISFAGGGTDIPEIAKQIGGCVTSVAISRYVYASLKRRNDKRLNMRYVKFDGSEIVSNIPAEKIEYNGKLDLVKSVAEELGNENGFDITVISEVPEHSGLGASGSLYVALISLFDEYYNLGMTRRSIAELSFRLEVERLKNRVGKQDQYAACYGGLNFIEFSHDMKVKISRVKTEYSTVLELEKNLALFFIGTRLQKAGRMIKAQSERFAESRTVKQAFLQTKKLGLKACDALKKNDLKKFGSIIASVWDYKRKFSHEMTNPLIECMHRAALRNGAYGGKVSGAGGGGCGFWFCRDALKNSVVRAVEELGAKSLEYKFDFEGVKTWKI